MLLEYVVKPNDIELNLIAGTDHYKDSHRRYNEFVLAN